MKRDVCKFLSGMFVGFAIEHALIAVFILQGTVNQPHYFGSEWGAQSAWFGAAMYLALSIWVGYLGWRTPKASDEAKRSAT